MMKMRVIANPESNKGKGINSIPDVEKALKKYGVDFDLVQTSAPWHAARLAQEAVALGYEVVVAAGGDGTANEVLNGLLLAREAGLGQARLALLSIGRGNDLGYAIDVPHDLEKSAAILANGHTRSIDIGFVRSGLYPMGRYFANGIGIGIDAAVNFVATRSKISGFAGYLVAALRTLAVYDAPRMEIQLDDMHLEQTTLLVSAMNGRRMGGGFLMAPRAEPDDSMFDVLIADGMSKLRTLTVLPRLFNGSQERDNKVHIHRGRKLTVRALTGNLPSQADGETVSTTNDEICVELLPKSLEIFTVDRKKK